MIILTAPNAGLNVRVCLAQTGDVDEQAVPDVDPACVDDVEAVASFALGSRRVDVEEVISLDGVVVVGVVVHRPVHVFGQVFESSTGDLGVEVPVPRKYLHGEGSENILLRVLGIESKHTLPFHHQPSRVPCAIHVSIPSSRNVFR